eukprot:2599526-Prymnesium_polylepis.1
MGAIHVYVVDDIVHHRATAVDLANIAHSSLQQCMHQGLAQAITSNLDEKDANREGREIERAYHLKLLAFNIQNVQVYPIDAEQTKLRAKLWAAWIIVDKRSRQVGGAPR